MVNIKLIKSVLKIINKDYNDINEDNFIIAEASNPYGHVREFNKLKKNIKSDAHRVISPLAVKLAGIEEIYSITDINGNTYDFEIFEEGNYRVSEVAKFKNYIKEEVYEKYSNKNS